MHRMNYAEVKAALKQSPSWHQRIADESGCKRFVIRQIVNVAGYVPRVDQVEMLSFWFEQNGIPEGHVHTARAAARRQLAGA